MDELRTAIESIHSCGSYACSTHVKDPCNPGLIIHGYGSLGLPLSSRDAAGLLEHFSTASEGGGSKRVSSSNRPASLVLSADKVVFDNPAWQPYVQGLCDTVQHHLGATCWSRLVLRNLLLTGEERSRWPSCQEDVEKGFGTVMITLPSTHEGAVVSLTRGSQTQTVDSAPSRRYGTTCAAWYNGTAYDCTAVTSGVFLALIYDMVQTDDGPKPTATTGEENVQGLRDALALWKSSLAAYPDILVHCLENLGGISGLGTHLLLAEDEAQVRCLETVCAEQDVHLYLANLVRQTHKKGDEDDDEEDDEESQEEEDRLVLAQLTDLHGNSVATDMEIGVESLLQRDPYSEYREPDEEEEEEEEEQEDWDYEGSLAITRTYRDKVWLESSSPDTVLIHVVGGGACSKESSNFISRHTLSC